jgi:hypothetical protein
MNRPHYKEESITESNKTTPSKKYKRKSTQNSHNLKLNLHQLSQAFYAKTPNESLAKIVFLDEFEADKDNPEGAITSRFLPLEGEGDSLRRCQKVENLAARAVTPRRKGGKEERERKVVEARGRKGERKGTMNLRRMNLEEGGSLLLRAEIKAS